MYILKNAWRSIVRSPGRTILITLLVAIIAAASCIALSIQQSADVARLRSESQMTIKAHINIDRQYVMKALQEEAESENSDLQEAMKNLSGLSLDELKTYAEAEMVDSFYYYATISLNGENGLEALNQETETTETQITGRPVGGPGGMMPGGSLGSIQSAGEEVGDFILYGYVSDASMEAFQDGTSYITQGKMFEENADAYECIITEELATFNSLEVGDWIMLSNPHLSSNLFTFKIVGIYKNSTDSTTTVHQAYDDPANYILTSYPVVQNIVDRTSDYHDPAETKSTVALADGRTAEQLLLTDGTVVIKGATDEEIADTDEEDDSDENEIAISETVTGTYVFPSIEAYDAFEAEVYRMGLEEKYVVTSNDVASFEASLVPLNNLSNYAVSFLYIILAVGAVILTGVSLYNIRERKYEIGALTAMGMRKNRVALQFVTELTVVTFLGIVLGMGAGILASTPVTNELLSTQVQYEQNSSDQTMASFGRDMSNAVKPHGGDVEGEVDYLDEVEFSFDYSMLYKMAAIGALLALISSAAAMIFILRYNPLDILAERN